MSRDLLLTGAWVTLVIGAAGFAYWCAGKANDAVEHLAEAVDLLEEDRESSRAAADDAANAVQVLRTWWSEAAYYEPEPQPATQPHQPPTMPEHRALGRIDDVQLAHSLAELEDRVRDWRTRPVPYKRGA